MEATDAAAPAPDADILDAPDLAAADAQVVPDVLGDDGDVPDAMAGSDASDTADGSGMWFAVSTHDHVHAPYQGDVHVGYFYILPPVYLAFGPPTDYP